MTEFKAKCLGLIDEISQTGDSITITKRGRPVATVGPVRKRSLVSTEGAWAGAVRIPDDDLTADRSDRWNVLRQKRKPRDL